MTTVTTTEGKLDALLKSVTEIQQEQKTARKELEDKITRLEEDVKTSNLEAAEKAVKKAKRERPLEFKRKGHEEQYRFNQDIGDCIASATNHIAKIATPGEKDKAAMERAVKELQEGMALISQRKKFIRIADQSEHHWQTVAAYRGNDLAEDEDAKRLEKAEKMAEQQANKRRHKTVASRLGPRYDSPSTSTLVQKPPSLPRPQFNGNRPPPRMPGPCFNCFEMGHLKAACPKLATTYPFKSSVDVCASYVCMHV